MDKKMMDYMGNPYQLFGTRRYTLRGGLADGVEAIDVKTGGGFAYTVLPSRALDISLVTYKGMNLTYLSPAGEVHPAYFTAQGDRWLHSFFGGLLTTCGPQNIGRPCETGGRQWAQHDIFTNTPARDVCAAETTDEGICITGTIDFGVLAKEKLRVRRRITSPLFSSVVRIEDEIENYGYAESALTLLYHTNWGYPFLTEQSRVYADASGMECYDAYSQEHAAQVFAVSRPDAANREKNYFHTMNSKNGLNRAAIANPELGLAALLTFGDTLPYMTHCKVEKPADYLVALEPCNTLCMGREAIERRGILPHIAPGETIRFSLQIEIFEGAAAEEMIKQF